MAYDYDSLRQDVALPLIQRFGLPISLIRKDSTAVFEKQYDPLTKSFVWVNVQTGEIFTEEHSEVILTYNGFAVRTRYRDEAIDGTLVKRGDVRLLVIDIPKPQLGDTIQVEDTVYSVVQADPIAPGATTVIYKVQVRV